jgi:hypothetical protein
MAEDRAKLSKLTVVELRHLARKRLGRGTSKLRTKAQLIEALAGPEIAPVTPKPARGAAPRKAPRRAPGKSGGATVRATSGSKRAATASAAAPDLPGETGAPEPLVALPLDGQTLLVRWKSVVVKAKGERWEIEVSSNGQLTRTVPVAPQSRQAYVRALDGGSVYRAQLVARDRSGRSRVVAALSRPVVFFPQAPVSQPPRERFVRYSWSNPGGSVQGDEQPAPEGRLPRESELAALGATAPTNPATSPTGSVAGAPLGWMLGSRRPTSFAS